MCFCITGERINSTLHCDTGTPISTPLSTPLSVIPSFFFLQVVFRDIEDAYYESTADVEAVMIYVLRHFHQLSNNDATFKATLSSLAFLDHAGTLTTPDRFFSIFFLLFYFLYDMPHTSYNMATMRTNRFFLSSFSYFIFCMTRRIQVTIWRPYAPYTITRFYRLTGGLLHVTRVYV